MTEWSKHVHRFAKKHNMSYKQANVSRKCKEAYEKRKTSPRRKRKTSPRRKRKTSPRRKRKTSPRRKRKTSPRRMNGHYLDPRYASRSYFSKYPTDALIDTYEEFDEKAKDTEEKLETMESVFAERKRAYENDEPLEKVPSQEIRDEILDVDGNPIENWSDFTRVYDGLRYKHEGYENSKKDLQTLINDRKPGRKSVYL